MLDRLLEISENNYSEEREISDCYFEVAVMKNIQDFILYFRSKVVDYAPDENGIYIDGKFYDDWSGSELPMIIDNHLILYDTDQQMYYQNLPTYLLENIISSESEIWT